MTGFLTFLTGCAIVASLSVIAPDTARWVALSIFGVLFSAFLLRIGKLSA